MQVSWSILKPIAKYFGLCRQRKDQVKDEDRSGPSERYMGVTGKELVRVHQRPSTPGNNFDAFEDAVFITGGFLDWRQFYEWRDTHLQNSPFKKREREDAEAPNYGTVTMVRNGTRRMLNVYEQGKRELYVKVRRWSEVALPRRVHVDATLVIEAEDLLGRPIVLECVIDRFRNQDVIVTADDYVGWLVRVLDRTDSSSTPLPTGKRTGDDD